jgi:hypothetical protein
MRENNGAVPPAAKKAKLAANPVISTVIGGPSSLPGQAQRGVGILPGFVPGPIINNVGGAPGFAPDQTIGRPPPFPHGESCGQRRFLSLLLENPISKGNRVWYLPGVRGGGTNINVQSNILMCDL